MVILTSSYLSLEMLKFIDKIVFIDEGKTIYFGKPFETAPFINSILKTQASQILNPICLLSDLLNKNLQKIKFLTDSAQNRILITYES